MQLDRTRVVIRERDLLDVLDMAGRVIVDYAGPWLLTSLVGALPFALLNYWLLGDFADYELSGEAGYVWRMIALIVFEFPLASVLTTVLLGQVMFLQLPSWPRMIRSVLGSLPQLLWYQVVIRGLLVLWPFFVMELWFLAVLWPIPASSWPYLNEVILLERNPLRGRAITTRQRSKALHGGASGDLFARWLGCIVLAALLTLGLWLSLWYVLGMIVGALAFDRTMFTVWLPVAMWTVASYFAVVRFLSYLDLRIRREGWEVELAQRAEAARMAGALES